MGINSSQLMLKGQRRGRDKGRAKETRSRPRKRPLHARHSSEVRELSLENLFHTLNSQTASKARPMWTVYRKSPFRLFQ